MKNAFIFLIFIFSNTIYSQYFDENQFVEISPGFFYMGSENSIPDSLLPGDRYDDLKYLKEGDFDEFPVRKVTITKPFKVLKTEVKTEIYKLFDPEFVPNPMHAPYVTGISWYEASEFCKWISEKTGKNYRLPTEAEWEYIAKSKNEKVENLQNQISEWVNDWYDKYEGQNTIDPSGPQSGLTKVIRGGGLDKQSAFFLRPSNRASMGPAFPPESHASYQKRIQKTRTPDTISELINGDGNELKTELRYLNFIRETRNKQGEHNIGFRIVEAPPLKNFTANRSSLKSSAIKMKIKPKTISSTSPHFRKRYVLPTPMDDSSQKAILNLSTIGLENGLLSHNHSPALTVMPNGDLLMVIYTSVSETSHDVKLICSRLRYGADDWDMPETLIDFADANDHAPLLWQEADTTRLYWGNNKYEKGFPFQWIESYDYGQTWTTPKFPIFNTPVQDHSAQPITSAFRDENGYIYVASDGVGSSSVLWRSEDNGKTWIDPKGRTPGRHSAIVQLNDGKILAMGGKSSQIDGYMPMAISSDKGVSWEISKSPFIAQGPGQRPSIIRLKSGKLLMSGDFSSRLNDDLAYNKPSKFPNSGSYVAWSNDEGKNWRIKKLQGTQYANIKNDKLQDHTLGYSVLRQAPDGNIHLLATVVHPVQHYEFNEAWLMSKDTVANIFDRDIGKIIHKGKTIENYSNQKIKGIYAWVNTTDNSFLFNGKQKWYYPDGEIKYLVQYKKGMKIGKEIFFALNSKKRWEVLHKRNGSQIRKTYHPNGKLKSISEWKGKFCDGSAVEYDNTGKRINSLKFKKGVIIN